MECNTVTSCVLLTVLLSSLAQQAAGSPPSKENRSAPPDPAAVFARGRPVPGEAMLMVRDYVKQGDTLLGERLKESFSSLKELLFEGDAHLKERVLESVSQLKAQLKERDDQLKEELDEDVALLKDRLAKGQSHVKEQLAEEDARTTEDLTEQKHALDTLRQTMKQWTQSSGAMMDKLKQQVTLLQEDLKATKQQLSSTQTELRKNQQTLNSIKTGLPTNQPDHTPLQKTKSSEEELQKTLEQLQSEVQANTAVRAQLQAAEKEIRSLRADPDSFQSGDPNLSLPQSSQAGSTFTRWGRNTCPANTSLVYAGVAGGTWYDHTGGASNYLCLVMNPQVDNTTVPSSINYLYGAEYKWISGHHKQDVVCSVCLAPHAVTLMIPATLTCPDGWTVQYRGHLASAFHGHKGRTEYMCLDLVRENRHAGHVNNNGALFYLVTTSCGSLPCPPYINNKVVTCVVCSK